MRNHGAPSVHKGRIAYLDGWRGLAILAVPIGHFVPSLGQAGSLGVELFFVLSGRLMASILFEEKIPAEQLFAGRFSRIYPGLLLYCAAIFFVSVTAQGMGIWW